MSQPIDNEAYYELQDQLAQTNKRIAELEEELSDSRENHLGCEYCSQSSKSIDNGEVGVSKAILYLCAKSKRIHFMDAKGKLAIFDIKYCPMCGKRLEVEYDNT